MFEVNRIKGTNREQFLRKNGQGPAFIIQCNIREMNSNILLCDELWPPKFQSINFKFLAASGNETNNDCHNKILKINLKIYTE